MLILSASAMLAICGVLLLPRGVVATVTAWWWVLVLGVVHWQLATVRLFLRLLALQGDAGVPWGPGRT